MPNEKLTQLPTVANATASDLIYAVQSGTSVQETIQQVLDLSLSTTVLNNAGNPNGAVAGNVFQLLWDTTNDILWVCTSTGTSLTAVWKPVIGALTNGQLRIGFTGSAPFAGTLSAGAGISIVNGAGSITISGTASAIGWTEVTAATQAMAADNGYVANRATLVTFTLPATAAFGTVLNVIGKGAGGWLIAQNAGQNIQIGTLSSTIGVAGTVASTNRFDSIELICTTADTTWTVLGGPQGNLTIV